MNSSISRFDHRFLSLLVALVVGLVSAGTYTFVFNPEVSFWRGAFDRKMLWANGIQSTDESKCVFVGGSTTAFQVDAARLTREYDVPAVNFGMHAGMGSLALLRLASQALRSGDTLVVSLETGFLSSEPEWTPLGIQVLFATGVIVESSPMSRVTGTPGWGETISSLRPGLRTVSTMLGKSLAGRPPYRYSLADVSAGGEISTDVRAELKGAPAEPMLLSAESGEMLAELRRVYQAIGVEVRYLLPVRLIDEGAAREAENFAQELMGEINHSIPVLPDPASGVEIDAQLFADTIEHMTKEGRKRRTEEIARLLRSSK